MPHPTIYLDLTDTADERFDRPIEAGIVLLLLFSPLAIGTVQAWSEWVVILLAAGMAAGLGVKLLSRPDLRFVWSWTYVPIGVVLLLGILQIIPFSARTIQLISPNTYRIKASLLELAGQAPGQMMLSFYPEATFQNLRMLTAIATVYIVALNVIRRAEQVRRMLMAMVVVGTLVALIALGHMRVDARQVYGVFGEPMGRWITGPMISRNHFGQYMNLGLGAALAVLLIRAGEISDAMQRRAPVSPRIWGVAVAAVVMAVAMFLSLSRGAILSLVISGFLAMIVAGRRGMSARLWMLLPVAWVVALVVIYFGFDLIVGRFAQTGDLQESSVSGRLTILRDVLGAARQTPILGYGLGSFETVYPMFDSSTTASLAVHAENDYAQALFEGGAIELGMVLVFAGMIVWSYVVCVRSAQSPMAMPAVGLGLGIGAVLVHSAGDFGQHLPANALMTAVQIAMLMNLAAATRLTMGQEVQEKRGQPGTRAVGVIAAAIVLGWVVYDGWNAARAEWRWFEVRAIQPELRARGWEGSTDDYARLLVAAEDASRIRPRDVHYGYWLNFFRFRAISQERDPQTGQIMYDAEQLGWARQIAARLRENVERCPTYGPNFSLAGQIEWTVLEQPEGKDLIRRGFALSRIDAVAAFESGMLDAREGQWEQAMAKFEHAAALVEGYRAEGAVALAGVLERPDLAMTLADENVDVVRRVVDTLQRTGQTQPAAQARATLNQMIRERAGAADASGEALVDAARLAMSESNPAAAVEYLDRAMLVDPTRADWRVLLARALEATGDIHRALSEAELAQRMRAAGADSLVTELRLKSATAPAQGP